MRDIFPHLCFLSNIIPLLLKLKAAVFFVLTDTLVGYIIKIPRKGIFEGGERMEEKECCCCKKKKERSEEEYKSLIHRLSRIEGQIRGIKGMVENNAYCTDILTQVSAASAALNAFTKELLSNHIKTCVARDIKDGKDETIDELVTTLQKLMK